MVLEILVAKCGGMAFLHHRHVICVYNIIGFGYLHSLDYLVIVYVARKGASPRRPNLRQRPHGDRTPTFTHIGATLADKVLWNDNNI
jgi:hypothetical protein